MQLIVYSLNNPYTSEKRKYESNSTRMNLSTHRKQVQLNFSFSVSPWQDIKGGTIPCFGMHVRFCRAWEVLFRRIALIPGGRVLAGIQHNCTFFIVGPCAGSVNWMRGNPRSTVILFGSEQKHAARVHHVER